MIGLLNNMTKHIEFLNSIKESMQGVCDDCLFSMRRQAIERFSALGFPTIKDEEWKYTNLDSILEKKFKFYKEHDFLEEEKLFSYLFPNPHKEFLNIVFINGKFSSKYSNLFSVPGVSILNLREALCSKDGAIHPYLERYGIETEDVFACLNKAFMNQGIFIKLDQYVNLETPIHLVHVACPKEKDQIFFPKNIVVLNSSSQVTLIESYISFGKEEYFTNASTDIFLENNTKCHYSKIEKESFFSFHMSTTRVCQKEDSQFESFYLNSGAKISRNNLQVLLNGQNAQALLNGLYIGKEDQVIDQHVTVEHKQPYCMSKQIYKGILEDQSRGVFDGKIMVHKNAQFTDAMQTNKNLLLSPQAHVDTRPQLLIAANDVKCKHGASIGYMDEEQIFYLASRGIAKEQAQKLLANAFANEVLVGAGALFFK